MHELLPKSWVPLDTHPNDYLSIVQSEWMSDELMKVELNLELFESKEIVVRW